VEEERNCLYCGAALPASTQRYKRKYCSTTCSNKYRLRLKKPDVQEKLWVHEAKVFEQAMGMYWSGIGSAAISRKLEIPVGTMYSWVHDFGGERARAEPLIYLDEKAPHVWSLKECFRQAINAEKWLELLQNIAQSDESCEEDIVRLVCGKLHGQSASRLNMVIFEKLKADPLSGETFAFCNKCGNIITTITWREPIYHIAKYIKTQGTFIWPDVRLGKSIQVTKTEFERLIALKKSARRKR
jgi:transposase-like protein